MKVVGHKCHCLYSRIDDFQDVVDTVRRIHFTAVSRSCGWNLQSFLIGNVNEHISSMFYMSSLSTALWKCFKLNPHCTSTCINNTKYEGKRVKKKAAAMMYTETFNAWQTFPRLSLLQTNRIIVWKIRWSLAERLWCTDHQTRQIHTEIWQKVEYLETNPKC